MKEKIGIKNKIMIKSFYFLLLPIAVAVLIVAAIFYGGIDTTKESVGMLGYYGYGGNNYQLATTECKGYFTTLGLENAAMYSGYFNTFYVGGYPLPAQFTDNPCTTSSYRISTCDSSIFYFTPVKYYERIAFGELTLEPITSGFYQGGICWDSSKNTIKLGASGYGGCWKNGSPTAIPSGGLFVTEHICPKIQQTKMVRPSLPPKNASVEKCGVLENAAKIKINLPKGDYTSGVVISSLGGCWNGYKAPASMYACIEIKYPYCKTKSDCNSGEGCLWPKDSEIGKCVKCSSEIGLRNSEFLRSGSLFCMIKPGSCLDNKDYPSCEIKFYSWDEMFSKLEDYCSVCSAVTPIKRAVIMAHGSPSGGMICYGSNLSSKCEKLDLQWCLDNKDRLNKIKQCIGGQNASLVLESCFMGNENNEDLVKCLRDEMGFSVSWAQTGAITSFDWIPDFGDTVCRGSLE